MPPMNRRTIALITMFCLGSGEIMEIHGLCSYRADSGVSIRRKKMGVV